MENSKIPTKDTLKRVGPAGNKKGEVWEVKSKVAITKFIVSHEPQKINSLKLQYVDEDGNFTMSETFGNSEFVGTGFLAVKIDYPEEYITYIKGWYSDLCVEELTISTNKTAYTFGKASESEASRKSFVFEIIGDSNEFGGFHGTCDSQCILSIGIYFNSATITPQKIKDHATDDHDDDVIRDNNSCPQTPPISSV